MENTLAEKLWQRWVAQLTVDLLPDTDKELITDGYHSFKELYDHRVVLFIALCNTLNNIDWLLKDHNDGIVDSKMPWKSRFHNDSTMFDGWFIAWIWFDKWDTLTYHLPMSEWDNLNVQDIDFAPEWDWHTSNDVLLKLRKIHV